MIMEQSITHRLVWHHYVTISSSLLSVHLFARPFDTGARRTFESGIYTGLNVYDGRYIPCMPFECRQCGKCCMYMGDFIVIERQVGPYEFMGCSVSTGTPFSARIDEDKRHLFSDQSWIRKHPSACPFLRPSGSRIVCTIHQTNPVQCKAYRCVIIRIRSYDGRDLGYVTGPLALHSDDPALREEWRHVEPLLSSSPGDPEECIISSLVRKGYSCT